jgi:hypothetical protein
MTGPRRESLSPVRRRGNPSAPTADGFADSEIARGQSDAVLGALGRMQLKLDLLAQEQSEALATMAMVLEQVVERLNALEGYDGEEQD